MSYTTIGKAFKLKSGAGLSAKKMVPGEYPVFGGNGISGYHNEYLFDEEKIVIGRVGAYCGNVHKTKPQSWITDNALYIAQAFEEFDTNYLVQLLRSLNLNKYASQSGQPLISAGRLKDVEIPIPPLEQQKKIAAILDAADGYKQKTKQLLSKYDELTQSLFLDTFGDPISNPKGWDKAPLDKCILKVDKIGKGFVEEEIEYVDIASIDNKHNIIKGTTSYNTSERPSRAQQILFDGDVIFSTVRPNLKNIAINNVDGRIGTTGFFVCRTNENKLNNYFLFKVLLADSVTAFFVGITSGANYPAVKSSDLRKFQVILPPIELQDQFSERVKLIDEQKELAWHELNKSDELFNSLLQKAFKGELA